MMVEAIVRKPATADFDSQEGSLPPASFITYLNDIQILAPAKSELARQVSHSCSAGAWLNSTRRKRSSLPAITERCPRPMCPAVKVEG